VRLGSAKRKGEGESEEEELRFYPIEEGIIRCQRTT